MVFIIINIFLCFLYYAKSEDINIWKYDPLIIENPTYENINITSIDSYAYDEVTGAELFLVNENGTSKFILKEDSSIIILNNMINKSIEIKSPLIKTNSNYYCCSSESLIWIDRNNIIEEINSDVQNFTDMKCLRGINDLILVSFIGTKYFSYFDPSNNKWKNTLQDPLSRNIKCINYYYLANDQPYYISAGMVDNDNDNYIITTLKYNNGMIDKQDPYENYLIKNNSLYEKAEMIIKKSDFLSGDHIIFLFLYTPNTSNYVIYHINIQQKENEFYEIKFFRFFNIFRIKYAGFILEKPYLYYSIESIINGQNYIGLVDIEYLLLIFNIEENINNNKL